MTVLLYSAGLMPIYVGFWYLLDVQKVEVSEVSEKIFNSGIVKNIRLCSQ